MLLAIGVYQSGEITMIGIIGSSRSTDFAVWEPRPVERQPKSPVGELSEVRALLVVPVAARSHDKKHISMPVLWNGAQTCGGSSSHLPSRERKSVSDWHRLL